MSEFIEVPCVDCEKEKNRIEQTGLLIVLGCKPVEGKPELCRIEYRLNI